MSGKIGSLFEVSRPGFIVMTSLNAASAAALALEGSWPSWLQIGGGVLAVGIAAAGVNAFNDFVDMERDRTAWPGRPLPSGRLKRKEVGLLVAACYGLSIGIAAIVFNMTTALILLAAIVLGSVYSTTLRDRIGYLTLPFINGLIYLGGWSAFSPEGIFWAATPWALYMLGMLWQASHIMLYSPAHPTGEDGLTEKKAFLAKTDAATAIRLGFIFLAMTIGFAMALVAIAEPLGKIYLAFVAAAGGFAVVSAAKALSGPEDKLLVLRAVKNAAYLRMAISGGIITDVYFL